jgi:hypothetical protein
VSARGADQGPRAYIRPLSSALVAGGLYGSWAAFAHHGLGAGVALRAAWTQVVLSVTATLVLVLVLERLFRWPLNPVRGFWLAAVGTSTLSIVWLIMGHALAGTPRILAATAPSVIVGTVLYCGYAGMLLGRAARGADVDHQDFDGDG